MPAMTFFRHSFIDFASLFDTKPPAPLAAYDLFDVHFDTGAMIAACRLLLRL